VGVVVNAVLFLQLLNVGELSFRVRAGDAVAEGGETGMVLLALDWRSGFFAHAALT
jgi:hypothetical protein